MRKLFIDIGSFDGAELARALELGYEVHCFEPNPAMRKFLAPFESRATINYAVAWNADGTARLYQRVPGDSSDMSLSVIREKTNIDKENFVEVPTINIGRYLKELDRDVDVIKIDAECAEYYIIESILDYFGASRVKQWLVEDHSKLIVTWKDHRDKVLDKVNKAGVTLTPWEGHIE